MKKLIKIESVKSMPFKKVDWKLSNVCNYNCEYCYPLEKNGSLPFLDINTNKEVVDKLHNIYKDHPISFVLTGGEPTLYPNLYELCSYIKSKNKNNRISMFTNGSRTLRWWDEFLEVPMVDFIFFTFHYAQLNSVDKFIEVVNSIHHKEINGLVFFTCTDIDFNNIQEQFNYVADRVGIGCHLKKIHGPILNSYTDDQEITLQKTRRRLGLRSDSKQKSKLDNEFFHYGLLHYDDGSTELMNDPQDILIRDQNKFFGWECHIGIDRLVILVDTIYKGVCKVGGSLGAVTDDFTAAVTPVVCNRKTCTCGGEFFETKQPYITTKIYS